MRKMRWTTAIAVALIVAGCSSKEAPPDQTATTAPSGHGAYANCLREHGVSAPPGSVAGPPPGTGQDTWHKATQACATLAPGPEAS